MKNITVLLFWLLAAATSFAQVNYVLVEIDPSSYNSLSTLINQGLDMDHFIRNEAGKIETVLPDSELPILDHAGISYSISVQDLEAVYARKLMADTAWMSQRAACNLDNFDVGSMGGYHTYDEIVEHLDSMYAKYPNIISPKNQIGTSIEGRAIWAVKISDNPMLDESQSEGVMYADALTHAREPLSMEVTLYFMWWLLENYGQDPEATYLVNEREIHFVPIVNPDGYVYNQQTNPNGGGLWRKNRRLSPNGCYGVDINRNFSFGWGLASAYPCDNTYKGVTPFSERESRAVRDYLGLINPVIAFSNHSFGNKIITPFGFHDSVVNYEVYSELAGSFIPRTYRGYGNCFQMYFYNAGGVTMDYFHGKGIYGFTPEIGGSFWDSSHTICSQVQTFLKPFKNITWAAGAHMNIQNGHVGVVTPGQNFDLEVRLKNHGLSQSAQNVILSVESLSDNFQVSNVPVISNPIAPQTIENYFFTLNASTNLELLDSLVAKIEVRQDGIVTDIDTIVFFAGVQQEILTEDFEQGKSMWTNSGNGFAWDTTYIAQASGGVSLADSRYGSYQQLATSILEFQSPIDLVNAKNPKMEFWAKWSLEPNIDSLLIEVKRMNETTWQPIGGEYSESDGKFYTNHRTWVHEQIDLTPFINSQINLRFRLTSNSFVQSDGFYLDDLRVVDYIETAANLEDGFSDLNMSIYPNPNQGSFFLNLHSTQNREINITLIDLLGRKVGESQEFRIVAGEQNLPLDYGKQSAGIYFLEIESEGKRELMKVVLE